MTSLERLFKEKSQNFNKELFSDKVRKETIGELKIAFQLASSRCVQRELDYIYLRRNNYKFEIETLREQCESPQDFYNQAKQKQESLRLFKKRNDSLND